MPPIRHKATAPVTPFFQPRSRRANVVQHDYSNIQREEFIPTNAPRSLFPAGNPPVNPPTNPPANPPANTTDDPPPGADNYVDSDDDMIVETAVPTFTNIEMTQAEKTEAIRKWTVHKQRHEKKKKNKSSHVYYYMHREAVNGSLFPEVEGGPKILQEYKWHCKKCIRDGHLGKKYTVYESHRKGVTSGMSDHLKTHGITKQTHFARIHGYSTPTSGGNYTELDAWSGKPMPRARLTARESTRRWFVKSRQPFSLVESSDFQEMFLAHGNQCAYKCSKTLRNHIYDDFILRRDKLKYDLEVNCVSISFTLDMWTSPSRKPIFAIIGHWFTPDFEEKEEVLEFIRVEGEHSGERLAEITMQLLQNLKLKDKLFAITGDNASNNGTLCYHLFQQLKEEYDDQPSLVRPQMRFHGKLSFIRCLAHVINLVCKDVLNDLKAGTATEAKALLDRLDKQHKHNRYRIPMDNSRSAIAKVRLLNLWILRSSAREQDWGKLRRSRKPIYDVDTRWNSAFDMITQYLELEAEYNDFCNTHPQVKCLQLSNTEVVSLAQLANVLAPFKEHTLRVSQAMPSIARSLEIYWDLEDLLNNVTSGSGRYSELDQSVRTAFQKGKAKHLKYVRKVEKFTMVYAAHILDPRCKTALITDMMQSKADGIITAVKQYFKTEWPETVVIGTSATTSSSSAAGELPQIRPVDMSIARWKAIQNQREQDTAAEAIPLQSELDRWITSPPLAWGTNDSPDWVRLWWKNHHAEWPQLSLAARDLLPCSASEVDVERLFSGCRDEFGIRRHSLKAETVRVLTLLRSIYQTEDEADKALIKEAMAIDVIPQKNSILWRPDEINGHVEKGNKPGANSSNIHIAFTN